MKKIFTLMLFALMATVNAVAQDTWTVAGVTPICGVSWDPAATQNDMTNVGGSNFELVKEGCVLEANPDYEFKVVKNHSWAEAYPSSNYKFKVDETGTYTVKFKFNADSKEISVETTKTGGAVIGDKTWTVAGSSAALFGTSWDPANAANDMVKQNDGTYLLEKKGVALPKGAITYKVCANHAWDESYGVNGQDASFSIEEDGTYDVTFTFNPESKVVGAEAAKTGSAVIEKVYSLAGAVQVFDGENAVDDDDATVALFGAKWDPTDTSTDMQQDGTNYVFKKTDVVLPQGQIACKVVVNHSWSENYGAGGIMNGEENFIIPIEQAGTYTVTFTFDSSTSMIGAEPVMTSAGIDGLSADQGKSAAIRYDLSGRRVDNAHKGLVIMNGKKVVMAN